MKSPTMFETRYWFASVRSKLKGSNAKLSLGALNASGGKNRAISIRRMLLFAVFRGRQRTECQGEYYVADTIGLGGPSADRSRGVLFGRRPSTVLPVSR